MKNINRTDAEYYKLKEIRGFLLIGNNMICVGDEVNGGIIDRMDEQAIPGKLETTMINLSRMYRCIDKDNRVLCSIMSNAICAFIWKDYCYAENTPYPDENTPSAR